MSSSPWTNRPPNRTICEIDVGLCRRYIWRVLQKPVPVLAARRNVIIGIEGIAIACTIQPKASSDSYARFYAVREIVDQDTIEIVAGRIEGALELEIGTGEMGGVGGA